jgi:hypothetical protein
MDKLTALRYYSRAYRATATQLATGVLAREWMEGMPGWRDATREQLEQHAEMAATWASRGFLPEEGLPMIASGMTLEQATAMDPEPGQEMQYLADQIDLIRHDEQQ